MIFLRLFHKICILVFSSTILIAANDTCYRHLVTPLSYFENLYYQPSQLKFISTTSLPSLESAICFSSGRPLKMSIENNVEMNAEVEEWDGTTLIILEGVGMATYPCHFFHLLEHIVGQFAFTEDPYDVKRIWLLSDGTTDLASSWKGHNDINYHVMKAMFPNATVITGNLRNQSRNKSLKPVVRMNRTIISDRSCSVAGECSRINKHLGEARHFIQEKKMRQLSSMVRQYANVPSRQDDAFHVTFIKRNHTRALHPRVEAQMVDSISKIPGVQLTIAAFEKLSFQEQIQLIGQTDLLIGAHGNGLSHVLFLPDQASVIEIFPENYSALDYRLFADVSGIEYRAIYNYEWQDRETAYRQGNFGNNNAPVSEFDVKKISSVILSKEIHSFQQFPVIHLPN